MAETVTKLVTGPERLPIAFTVGEKSIDGVVIRPLMFSTFSDYVTEAQAMTEPKTFEARLRRVRMLKQVAYYSGTQQVALAVEEILRMPISAVRKISDKLDGDVSAGKVIRKGDGIEQSIVYELATPIVIGGSRKVSELEFHAETYGDIEDVLALFGAIPQTVALIQNVAKPLGTSLSRLTEDMVKQITTSDGFVIMNEVLPHFLGSADES